MTVIIQRWLVDTGCQYNSWPGVVISGHAKEEAGCQVTGDSYKG